MAFVQRILQATISIGKDTFVGTTSNSVVLTNYRMQASVTSYGLDTQGALQLRIYGLPLSMMNQLTFSGPVNMQLIYKNSLILAAGNDDRSPLNTIFVGSIFSAYADFSSMPDAFLSITAYSSLLHNIVPVNATTIRGSIGIDALIALIVTQMNTKSGVTTTYIPSELTYTFKNPYLPGSGLDQIGCICRAASCNYSIVNNVLNVWPIEGAIARQQYVPVISPSTGLIGYPTFNQGGLVVRTIFNPSILIGQSFTVEGSQIKSANQKWTAMSAVHTLESITPGGIWFTDIQARPFTLTPSTL